MREKLGMPVQRANELTPDGDQVKQQARRAAGVAQENPLGLAVGAAAIGFLAGMLLPSSDVEDEKLGPLSDQLKEQAKQAGQDAVEHGRAIAQAAGETARDQAQEHGQQLADRAREHAANVGN